MDAQITSGELQGERVEVQTFTDPKQIPDETSVLRWDVVIGRIAHLPGFELWVADECPLTLEDVSKGYLRSGIEQRGDTIGFLVVAVQNGDQPDHYLPIGFFIRPNHLITYAPEGAPALEIVFKEWVRDPPDIGPDAATLLHSILDAILDDYFPALDRVHDKIEELEDQIYLASRVNAEAFITLKRELLQMRKQLSPIRDNINSLVRYGAPLIPQNKILDFTDLYNHCLRLAENIDLGRDILSSIMDAQLSIISNRLNEVMRTLTVVSTMLMISSLIAGIYGMNFKHMPELDWKLGYPMAIGLMVVGSVVALAIFRKRRWL